jgi:periplasmic divalent cation tolerance protein
VNDAVFLYVTCPDAGQAETLGRALVEASLAACVNILPGMRSIYRWQGAVESADEAVMIVKTAQAPAAQAFILRHHPYDCPCVVVLPLAGGNPDYLTWIAASSATG